MLEILRACLESQSSRLGIATIVDVSGSAPSGAGTSMALTEEEAVIGSLSSGCVDSEVLEACRAALEDGRSSIHVFGYAPEDPFGIGLACGGTITVVVAPADRVTLLGLCPAASGHGVARLAWSGGEGTSEEEAADPVARWRWSDARAGESRDDLGRPLPALHAHYESLSPAPRALLYGANAFSAAVARQLLVLGYSVELCDPRRAFTDPARFPGCQVEVESPIAHMTARAGELTASDVVLMLAHDTRFDAPVLDLALSSRAGYVGALGSRATDVARRASLRALGHARSLAALHSPVGLDLGARTPPEIAVAIAAEIVARRHGREGSVSPLHTTTRAVHARRAGAAAETLAGSVQAGEHPEVAGSWT